MAHDLSKLEDKLLRIGQKSPDKLLSLLRASSYNGRPGLYMALQNGCAEAVLVFKALLEKVLPLIPKSAFDELLNILVAKRPDGLPGLVYAVLDDATETIEAYESLASILKPSQHALFIKHLTEVKEGSPFHSELMNPSSLIAISYYQMVSIVIGWRPNF
jgi:hypothetical protein